MFTEREETRKTTKKGIEKVPESNSVQKSQNECENRQEKVADCGRSKNPSGYYSMISNADKDMSMNILNL